MSDRSVRYQAPRFAVIGLAGFATDASILTLLVNGLGLGPVGARGISFGAAATLTWGLHRWWTFPGGSGGRRGREYARYVVVQVIGALINLGIYLLLISARPALGAMPVIPLAAGAAVAMLFTFLASRAWVFRQHADAS